MTTARLDSLLLYVTAPVFGAVMAAPLCRMLQGRDCCKSPDQST
jgi:hypothetical protein